jgi:hypothetical protein
MEPSALIVLKSSRVMMKAWLCLGLGSMLDAPEPPQAIPVNSA